jgi:Zn-dependent peptidase ImmA (M78 family)/transcriptional regulator with XRE-family HTH domain
MPKSPRAEVGADILRWARKTRGFSLAEAAQRIGVSKATLAAWEQTDLRPTVKQLRNAARVYLRPISLFFLDEPPEDLPHIKDFRRVADSVSEPTAPSPELLVEIRLARERRLEALELAAEAGIEIPHFSLRATMESDPEAVGRNLRQHLGISPKEQFGWVSHYVAFSAWRERLEKRGILVFQTGRHPKAFVDPKEARGFSVAEVPLPIVVANGKESPTARSFTLIHELTHLMLRNGGLCDLHHSFRIKNERDRVEQFCNHVAGATLVPPDVLLAEPRVRNHGDGSEWSDFDLAALSRRFWVSWEVILRRLLILGRTDRTFYQAWKSASEDKFPERSREKQSEDFQLPASIRVIKRNGRLFPRIVLEAYRQEQISLSRAADYLGTGPHQIDKIDRAVFRGRSIA